MKNGNRKAILIGAVILAVIAAIFGLCFGALCAIPYFFIGLASGGVSSGVSTAVTWWIAGIPWDFVHCVGNFFIMLILYAPVSKAMKWVTNEQITDRQKSVSEDTIVKGDKQ